MNKIEELLLKISRIFGVFVLGITFLIILFLTVVLISDSLGKLTAQKYPEVKFYQSDFVEEKTKLPDNHVRPDKPEVKYAKLIVKNITGPYKAKLNSYIAKNEENLFPYEATRDEQKKKYEDNRIDVFTAKSQKSIEYILGSRIPEKFYSEYYDSLFKYFKEAEDASIEIYTSNGIPVSNIYSSPVFSKFNQEFINQVSKLEKGSKSGGLTDILENAAVYAALFFLITIFLMVSVMFAIIRIEKKMG